MLFAFLNHNVCELTVKNRFTIKQTSSKRRARIEQTLSQLVEPASSCKRGIREHPKFSDRIYRSWHKLVTAGYVLYL